MHPNLDIVSAALLAFSRRLEVFFLGFGAAAVPTLAPPMTALLGLALSPVAFLILRRPG